MKLFSYPDNSKIPKDASDATDVNQGVGPHRDSDFLTFIYQATDHNYLQVQTFNGEWFSLDHIKGSLIVNGGQKLEAVTNGVCKASIHRVNSPEAGSDAFKTQIEGIPEDIIALRDERDRRIRLLGSDVGFEFSPDLDKELLG
ncbi:Clavaminate synthase-like protein [Metschnikowia bicuspidata]|uniref:Clavaminate synthase-like protein n=1 Tax=Metschnikowia bicuspidata TaxID=27322 RepID=A0A4P9ZKE8_9ASCO|nr:Clavaminate synthase-like protein [Metschnikowia bicuspidata]